MKTLFFIGFFLFFIVISILLGVKGRRLEGVVWLSIFATLAFIFFVPGGNNIQQVLGVEFLKNVVDECCMLYILKITYTAIFAFLIFNFIKNLYVCWKLEKLLWSDLTIFFDFFEKVLLICSIAILIYWIIPMAMRVHSYLIMLHFFGINYELLSTLGNFEEFVIMCTKGDPNVEKINLGDADVMIATTKSGQKVLCAFPDKIIYNELGEVTGVKKSLMSKVFTSFTGFKNLGPLCIALKPAEGIVVEATPSLNVSEVITKVKK
uniref:Uncharacterized protein n=1 Tax=Monodopsis sp. MarTras21 TaxID=1745953 RepID=A0A140F2Y1_9STRA|nr:hypothetical protein [Monodopsis sp. MarTras21]